MKKQTKRYGLTDLLLAILKTELRREVNRLDVIGFSELNAPRITKLTTEMIERLLKSNRREFIKIAQGAADEAAEDLKELGISVVPITPDGKYVDGILREYNPITGYLYKAEADRKRARLAEALITALLIASRSDYHKQLHRFSDLWYTQTKQYGETMVDKARIDTFKKNGIKRVMWKAENDEKVCEECKARDGKIYLLSEYPGKAHYNCRCWLIPIKDNNGK